MITIEDAIDLAIDEHDCKYAEELMHAIYDSIGSCEYCVHSNEDMWCSFLANGTTVQPHFFCAAFIPNLI